MTTMTATMTTLTNMIAKEDDGGDNGHKITINRCDDDGQWCAMHWRTVPWMMTVAVAVALEDAGLR
jgi:hypothetical protein